MIRNEYPRPQFKRPQNWDNLNGQWNFKFDDKKIGLKEKWQHHFPKDSINITVPFVFQSPQSGINCQEVHDVVWYQRSFDVDSLNSSERLILHFGAVDYWTKVYVNGDYVGDHEGGDVGFDFNITDYLDRNREKQELVVRVADRTYDETIPRGKQSWTGKSEGIWYTNSTGIWQTVWLEVINQKHIKDVSFTPDLDHTSIKMDLDLSQLALGSTLKYTISIKNQVVAEDLIIAKSNHIERTVELMHQRIFKTEFHQSGWTWSPEHPNLFDVHFQLIDDQGQIVDDADSYFGLRKIHTEKGMIFLNNRPYYQKLVLDQGYWPEGLLTAPNDESFRQDIMLAKQMGFNGCRKHQKIEDPRFLYWADKLGYIVWEEIASVPYYSTNSVSRVIDAWKSAVKRDYNHPSIIMWVPLNESWGVDHIHISRQQQHFSEALYHMIHALDTSRLVQSNDGWDNTVTDVVAIHNYSHGAGENTPAYKHFVDSLSTIEKVLNQAPGWSIFAEGFYYQGQPVVLSEFGGISFDNSRDDGWGYTSANSQSEYIQELQRVINAVSQSQVLWGYCYTQLTDVEQETNGLLTYDRKPKADLNAIHQIFDFDVNRLSDMVAKYRNH